MQSFILRSTLAVFSFLSFSVSALELKSYAELDSVLMAREHSGAALVKKKGETLLRSAFGLKDADSRIPNSPHVRFAIGSSTKQMTAAAIMLLVDRGQLSLDDTLAKLLPEYKFPWADKVNVHHLLTHTSGVFNYTDVENFLEGVDQRAAELRTEDLIAIFHSRPLGFEPGTRWDYSNSGFLLAGVIVERLSGKAWGDFLQDEFFTPLGMNSTGYEPYMWAPRNAMPLGFDRDYKLENMPYRFMKWADAAGGVMSTIDDYSLWMQWLHRGGKILSDESLELMKAPHVAMPGGGSYGYGIMVGRMGEKTFFGHGGDLPGFHFLDLYFPETETQVIVATNQEPLNIRSDIARALIGLSLTGTGSISDLRLDLPLSYEQLYVLAGDYLGEIRNADGSVIQLRTQLFIESGKLYFQIEGQDSLWMIPQSETSFALKNIASLEFTGETLTLNQDGFIVRFVRVPPQH